MRSIALNAARIAVATTAVVAMAYQFAALNVGERPFSAGNFFSFFTIQSNILGVAALGAAALVRPYERPAWFDGARGAAAFYLAITGAVFALLLAGHQESVDTATPWVDFTVHKLMPIAIVADWLLDPPRHRLRLWVALTWLAYPTLWFAYTLVRGAAEDWYPYPFADVTQLGYGGVVWRGVVMLVAFVAGAVVFLAVSRARLVLPSRRPRSRPVP